MKRLFNWIIGKIGRRGIVYGFYGFIALFLGLGSIGNPPSSQAVNNIEMLLEIAPIQFWYVLWTLTGLVCTTSAIAKRLRWLSSALFTFLCFCFSLGYLSSEIFGEHANRAWVGTILYGGFGLTMLTISGWPEGQQETNKESS